MTLRVGCCVALLWNFSYYIYIYICIPKKWKFIMNKLNIFINYFFNLYHRNVRNVCVCIKWIQNKIINIVISNFLSKTPFAGIIKMIRWSLIISMQDYLKNSKIILSSLQKKPKTKIQISLVQQSFEIKNFWRKKLYDIIANDNVMLCFSFIVRSWLHSW